MALRSGDGVPDAPRLVVDHDPKFTSNIFREFNRRLGSSLIVGSAYHKNTNARAERVNGVLGDKLRAFANGPKGRLGSLVTLWRVCYQQLGLDAGWGLDPILY
jgi:transposase InsO family protein